VGNWKFSEGGHTEQHLISVLGTVDML